MADDTPNVRPPISNNIVTGKQEGWNVKEAVNIPVDNTPPKQRVDLKPQDFNTLILQKGINVCVFRSMYCPNVKSADGAEHEIDCPLCNGSGYVDTDGIDCKAFIQNQDLDKLITQGGDWDGNTVLMTFPTGIELQYYTKIIVKDFTDLYYQRVLRNPDSLTDILKYKCCRANVLMDSNGVKYYVGADFNLDQNGNIIWNGGRKPVDNQVYSIHYETHMQYRAVKAMHVSRFSQFKNQQGLEFVKLPEQWMLAKEFLTRNKDINTKQDLNEGPFDDHVNTEDDNT